MKRSKQFKALVATILLFFIVTTAFQFHLLQSHWLHRSNSAAASASNKQQGQTTQRTTKVKHDEDLVLSVGDQVPSLNRFWEAVEAKTPKRPLRGGFSPDVAKELFQVLANDEVAGSVSSLKDLDDEHHNTLNAIDTIVLEEFKARRLSTPVLRRILPKSQDDDYDEDNDHQASSNREGVGNKVDGNKDTAEAVAREDLATEETTVQHDSENVPACLASFDAQVVVGDIKGYAFDPLVPYQQKVVWKAALSRASWVEVTEPSVEALFANPALLMYILPFSSHPVTSVWKNLAAKRTDFREVLFTRTLVQSNERERFSSEHKDFVSLFSRRQFQHTFLERFTKQHGCTANSRGLQPPTFLSNDPNGCSRFISQYGTPDAKREPWLLKHFTPISFEQLDQHRGLRIQVHESADSVRKKLRDCKDPQEQRRDVRKPGTTSHTDKSQNANAMWWNDLDGDMGASAATVRTAKVGHGAQRGESQSVPAELIQRAVLQPLLVHSRRCQLHAFVLVASTSPSVLFFNPGLVTIASPSTRSHVDGELGAAVSTLRALEKETTNIVRLRQSGSDLESSVWQFDRFEQYLTSYSLCGDEQSGVPDCALLVHRMKRVVEFGHHMHRSLDKSSDLTSGLFTVYQVNMWVDEQLQVFWKDSSAFPELLFETVDAAKELATDLLASGIDIVSDLQGKATQFAEMQPGQTIKGWELLFSEPHTKCQPSKYSAHYNPCMYSAAKAGAVDIKPASDPSAHGTNTASGGGASDKADGVDDKVDDDDDGDDDDSDDDNDDEQNSHEMDLGGGECTPVQIRAEKLPSPTIKLPMERRQ